MVCVVGKPLLRALFQFFGASLSEPHTDVLAWDSVTRDIYIYIGIGGPTAIFEPAPFLQPCTFFWPDLVDRKLHTEPRITRIPMHNTRLRSRAYCAPTNASPLISGQQKVHDVRSDRVSFQSRTRSTSTSRKILNCVNVNVVARSTLMRAHIAMHNAVVLRPAGSDPEVVCQKNSFLKVSVSLGGFGPYVAHGKHSVRRRCVQATKNKAETCSLLDAIGRRSCGR